MMGKNMMWIVLLVIVAAVGSSAVYTVDEREKAIVFQFGEIVCEMKKIGILVVGSNL